MTFCKQIASLLGSSESLPQGTAACWRLMSICRQTRLIKRWRWGASRWKGQFFRRGKEVLQQASIATRVGADPEKEPCGASAVLRTKRYRLEAFGRQEAAESKKRKTDVRMPEEFIQKVMDMPNMEMDVQLCGDDEYFAEGALIELQQGSKRIKPIDIGRAERGRKNESNGPAFRSRFTALFAYEQFDPTASSVFVVNLQDGKEIRIPADLSKVK